MGPSLAFYACPGVGGGEEQGVGDPLGIDFREIFDAAPDAILVVDSRGEIAAANRQVAPYFGYQPAELIGRSVDMLVPDSVREGHAALRDRYNLQPRMRPMGIGLDLFARRKDGSEFPVEVSLSPVRHFASDASLVCAVIRDISRRKLEEKELEASLASEREARVLSELAQGRLEFLSRAASVLTSSLDFEWV